MSDAKVEFLRINGDQLEPGEKPARFTFRCVGRNRGRDPRLPRTPCGELLIAVGPHSADHGRKRDPHGNNGGSPQWDWDGNREAPTFSPSINCEKHCGWHGYIRNGRCVTTDGTDEPE